MPNPKLTPRQREVLGWLAICAHNIPTIPKQRRWIFVMNSGKFNKCDIGVVERLGAKGLLKTVRYKTAKTAKITDAGRKALEEN